MDQLGRRPLQPHDGLSVTRPGTKGVVLGDLDRGRARACLASRRVEVQGESHRLGHRLEHGLAVEVVPEDVVGIILAEDAGHAGGFEWCEQFARS